MKSFAESRSIWANLIIALLVKFWPGAADWVSHNPEVFALGASLLNILLRFVTKTSISLTKAPGALFLAVLSLSGCAGVDQVLTPGVFYRRDLKLTIDGQDFEGVGVVAERPRYEIVISPKQDIDALLIKSCHRTISVEKISSGWFGNGKFKYIYEPIPGLESGRVCPLRIDSYNSSKGKHAWSFLDFRSSAYAVSGTSICNGAVSRFQGAAVCQAHRDLVQKISFDEPIRFAPPSPSHCSIPKRVKDGYEYTPVTGECIYLFDTQSGKLGRLVVIGFEGVKIDETQ